MVLIDIEHIANTAHQGKPTKELAEMIISFMLSIIGLRGLNNKGI